MAEQDGVGWGFVIDLGREFSVWLGIGGLALIWANLHLWHTRRVLKQLRQDIALLEGELVPSDSTEPASSVIAP